jgi:uncharacterized protein
MTRIPVLAALVLSASAAYADVDRAVSQHILPGFAGFAQAAAELDSAAQADCRAAQLGPAFDAAFDAWMAIANLRIGPSESAALSIAFWPDDRAATPRALTALIKAQDPVGLNLSDYADVSVAARGLFAFEMLTYDPAFATYGTGDYTCALVQTVAADLHRQAVELDEGWRLDFAPTLTSAGAAGNATYLSPDEAVRALYTQLMTGLEVTADMRLGRPMGTFDRPRPKQAEAWRSGRSLRNVLLSVEAAQALAHGLAEGDLPLTDAAADRVREAARVVADPGFQDVEDPQARLRLEVMQQAVRAMRAAIQAEIGDALGIAAGFNSQDGD